MDFEFPIVLNEYFALDQKKDYEHIIQCLDSISNALIDINKHNSKISLIRYGAMWEIVGENVSDAFLAVWNGPFKEKHIYLMGLEDRSVSARADADCDYILNGRCVSGFGVAVENDFCCISAPQEPTSEPVLEGTRRELDQECRIIEIDASCKNIVDSSKDAIRLIDEAFTTEILSLSDLWDQRETLFPKLRFLPRVQDNLSVVSDACFEQIFRKLSALNWSSDNWDTSVTSKPTFRTLTNPESRSRRKFFDLLDTDDEIKCFHYHCYFNPGEGRIHFYFDPSSGAEIVIGHIGLKVLAPLRR